MLVACAISVAWVLVFIQFPGLLSGDGFPTEPDILGVEGAVRRWAFGGPGHVKTLYPGSALGVSIWSVPVHGVFSPASWLGMAMPWAAAIAVGWYLHAALFVAGWTVALRRLGGSPVSALGAPLLILASGPVWSFHAVSSLELASLAYTGWAVAATGRWVRRHGAMDAAVLGATLSLVFMTGDPYMAPLAAVMGVVLWWHQRPATRTVAIGAAIAASVFLAVAFPLILEAIAFMPLSERAAPLLMSPHEVLSFSTPPARFLEVISSAFRLPDESRVLINAGSMNSDDFWFPSLTLGLVVIGLSAVGARGWANGTRASLWLGVLALLCIFLSVGRWSSVTAWAWAHIPPLSLMRFPERLWRYAVVLLVPLVSSGLMVASQRSPLRWQAVLPVALVLGGLAELLLQMPEPLVGPLPVEPPEFAALRGAAARHGVRIGVDHRTNFGAKRLRFDTRIYDLPMLNAPDPTRPPVLKYTPMESWPNHLSMRWLGVSHLIVPLGDDDRFANAAQALKFGSPISLGDTGYALVEVADSGPSRGLFLTRWSAGLPFDQILFDEQAPNRAPAGALATPVPRVGLGPFLAGLTAGRFLIDDRWALDGRGGVGPTGPVVPPLGEAVCDVHNGESVALIVAADVSSIDADVNAPCAGLLSIPWRFLPGWRAEANGHPVTIHGVNALTMGVFVPAGHSRVVFRWRPRGTLFVWWSLPFLAATATVASLQAWRRRRTMPTT